ncbi:NRG1 [Candida jiufengensis]|uniref:NRG1 n=1 Tax=Candida jiufengensis TaxID=497108 RepID=UPI002223F14B|nr:NRG1 [Candida jiufengensis]KAI5950151.1 NRG1 [Candida jiufengensis]
MNSLQNSPTQSTTAKPNLQSLPSFSELLTSIPPLPLLTPTQSSFTQFKSRSNSNSSTTSSVPINFTSPPQQQYSVVSSPYNYYTQPSVHHRLPTPPLNNNNSSNKITTSSNNIKTQYVSYPQQFAAPQPLTSTFRNPSTIDPITPLSNNFDHKIRSSSTGDIPHSSPQSSIKSISTTTTSATSTTQASPNLQQHHYQEIVSPTTSNSTSPKLSTTSSLSPKDPRRKHVCKVCSRSFTTSGHLARHNRIHTGERKHECPWPSCEARFARQDNCMQHYKTHTNGKNKRSRIYNNYNSQLNKENGNDKVTGGELSNSAQIQHHPHQQQHYQQIPPPPQHYQQIPPPPPQPYNMSFSNPHHHYPVQISSHYGKNF